MPLTYNVGQRSIPNVPSRVYKYTRLQELYTVELSDKSTRVLNPRKMIGDAWKYIENHCAKSKDCNNYFAKLRKKKTLADILGTVEFTVHRLIPKEGHKEEELPYANSAGSDFALSAYALLDAKSTQALAATILHEIAHFAGATTNTREANALEAENSLIPCGLRQYYNSEAKG